MGEAQIVELAQLVQDMRDAQRTLDRERTYDVLVRMRVKEFKVDAALEVILKKPSVMDMGEQLDDSPF